MTSCITKHVHKSYMLDDWNQLNQNFSDDLGFAIVFKKKYVTPKIRHSNVLKSTRSQRHNKKKQNKKN